jgi:hypothetical protein
MKQSGCTYVLSLCLNFVLDDLPSKTISISYTLREGISHSRSTTGLMARVPEADFHQNQLILFSTISYLLGSEGSFFAVKVVSA